MSKLNPCNGMEWHNGIVDRPFLRGGGGGGGGDGKGGKGGGQTSCMVHMIRGKF